MIKLYIFHTGSVMVDQAIPHHEKNPLAVTGFLRGKKKKMLLPVSSYLIQHPKGNVLVDTGWDTSYAKAPPKQMLGMVNRISAPILQEDEGIDSKLKAIGLQAKELDFVLLSHMDFDHTSGLRLVKDAKKIMTAQEEWSDCNKLSVRYVDTWTEICNVETFAFQNTGIGPLGKSYDLFGDGSIQIIAAPGHSKGHSAVKISNNGKYVVLGNDAAYTQKSFQKRIIPGFTVDKHMAEKSLSWLCDCKKDANCIEVFVNHDPSVQEHIVTL